MSDHGYVPYTRGCRCEVCRNAKSTYMRAKRRRARRVRESVGGRLFVEHIRHGTAGYKDHSCRCEVCRAAKSAEDARRGVS